MRKYVLDTNCYVDAARDPGRLAALGEFTTWAVPHLYLSTVVAAELRAGIRTSRERTALEQTVLGPFVRRGRVITPSGAAWDALGLTLATLRSATGLDPTFAKRSFAFDVLLAYSAREAGAVVVTTNGRDMERIRTVFRFEFVPPYPDRP